MRKTHRNNPITVGNLRTPGFMEGTFLSTASRSGDVKVLFRC
jgi:hypothetical protein